MLRVPSSSAPRSFTSRVILPRTRRRIVADASRRPCAGGRAGGRSSHPSGEDGRAPFADPAALRVRQPAMSPFREFRFQVSRPAADNSIRPAALSGGATGTFLRPGRTQSEAAASPNDSSMGGDVWVELYEAEASFPGAATDGRGDRRARGPRGVARPARRGLRVGLRRRRRQRSDRRAVHAVHGDAAPARERGNEVFATLVEEALARRDTGADPR